MSTPPSTQQLLLPLQAAVRVEADPLQEEPASQAKTDYYSDYSDCNDPEFPEGLLRCTPDKPAFSKTPSPKKESHQARRPSHPAHPLHSFTRAAPRTGRSRQQQQRPRLARHAGLGRHEGMGRRLLHRRTAPVKPPPRGEAARSHIRPDRRSAHQACRGLVVGHLVQAHGSPPLRLLARVPAQL